MSYFGSVRVTNRAGIEAWIGPFAEQVSEARFDDIAVQFQYPFYNTTFDMHPAQLTGDGAVTVANGMLNLSSTSGTAYAPSLASIRYRPGHSGFARFTAMWDGAGTGVIGAVDLGGDGFGVKRVGGQMRLFWRKAGVDTEIVPVDGRFPGGTIDISGIDFSKMNIFAVDFGYLGVASPAFWIKRGRWELLGIIETEGMLTGTHINNPVLPISAYTSGAMTLRTASWNGGTIGQPSSVGTREFHVALEATLSAAALATLGVFRNKTTYKTIANKVRSVVLKYALFVDAPNSGSGTVQFKIIKGATLAGTPIYADVDADNSVIEFDAVQTYGSGGRTVLTDWVSYAAAAGGSAKEGGGKSFAADELGIELLPGETAVITAQNVGLNNTNVTVRVGFYWVDLF